MRFAVHDGPGIRTAVFFKGCPLRCLWCHNPESQTFAPEMLFSATRCRVCGACADVCPHQAIVRNQDHMETTGNCAKCGVCADACAAEARTLAGREMTVAEILAEIDRDTVFYDDSGGGVTFTGGEPLAQPAALEALLHACRERRIHSAIETCGAAARETVLRICGLADLVLYDVKAVDAERHREYTGALNGAILENLASLAAAHPNVIVRVPLVTGVNDHAEDVRALCQLLVKLPVRRVDLLPYHAAGTEKYRRLGREYRLAHTPSPTPAALAAVASQMEAAGIQVNVSR